jgi:hypothetical protein
MTSVEERMSQEVTSAFIGPRKDCQENDNEKQIIFQGADARHSAVHCRRSGQFW